MGDHVEGAAVERDGHAARIEHAGSDRGGIRAGQLACERDGAVERGERGDLEEDEDLLLDLGEHVTEDRRPPGTGAESELTRRVPPRQTSGGRSGVSR